jgi:predicted membrane GTPase involved in stress response
MVQKEWMSLVLSLEVTPLVQRQTSCADVVTVHLAVPLDAAADMSLDDCVEYIQEDELVEVTPKSVRMCKNDRMSTKRKN